MTYFYTPNQKSGYKGIIISLVLFFITGILSAQETLSTAIETECINCFSSEIIQISQEDDCMNVDLMVYTTGPCNTALSHLVVEIPCGIVSDIYNSENWLVESSITDPTTGITGFKLDDIHNFGDGGSMDTVFISYTVCSSDPLCFDEIKSEINLAYKAGNCVFTDEISDKTEMSLNLTPQNVSCYGYSNGAVYSEVTGGEEPYSYLWSNGTTGPDLLNVMAGSYSLKVTDASGNIIEDSVSVEQPEAPVSIEAEVINSSCSASDGGINISVSGGLAPYSFRWSNGDSTQNISGVMKGSYSVQVTDALGCSASETFTVIEDSDLELSLTPNYLECYQEGEGEIISSVTGGTEPYAYAWSNGETTANISGLTSGLYNLTVTDANGCTKTKSAYIGIKNLSISANVQHSTCFGEADGEISIIAVGYGTAPFSYLWSTGDTTQTISGLESGRYEVTVTDANGCSATKTLTVADPRELDISYSVYPRDCSENSEAEVLLNGSGGSGTYEYYYGDTLVETTITFPGDGDYEIYMKDSNGCETTQTIHIESSNDLNIVSSVVQPSCTGLKAGYASLTVNGGTAPYSYEWPDGSSGSMKTGLAPGEYTVDAVDANGCLASTSFVIDSINDVSVQIEDPQQPECNSDNNYIYSSSTNATGYSWDIQSEDNSWSYLGYNSTQFNYQAGTGTATVFYHAWNEDGCEDIDSVTLVCSTGGVINPPEDTTGTGGDSGEDGSIDPDCQSMCWETEITKIQPLDFNCYEMELRVMIKGYCEHDLSHLVIGFDNAYVSNLTNSANYKVEVNSTDPKSGVTGFKVDDIEGFGNEGMTEFTINFEVCFSEQQDGDYLPDIIPVIYKAATCTYLQELAVYEVNVESGDIVASAYPNPFLEEINVRLNSTEDTEVNISVFDLRGNKVAELFDGKLKANVNYTFPFKASNNSNDRIFIYKIVSPDQVLRGQILRQK